MLGFEDNQFKKQKLDKHDSVISMLHATKEAMINPFNDSEEDESNDASDHQDELNEKEDKKVKSD